MGINAQKRHPAHILIPLVHLLLTFEHREGKRIGSFAMEMEQCDAKVMEVAYATS